MLAFRLVILIVFGFGAASPRPLGSQGSPEQGDTLRVRLVQSRASYCAADSEVYTAELKLSAEYSNVSKQRLTLVIGSEVADSVTVAATEADLTLGRSELQMDLESYPADAEGTTLLGENVKREKVLTVAPGGTIQSEIQISLPVRRTMGAIPGTLAPGKHIFVVGMRIRNANRVAPKGKSGWLSIRSQPVSVDLPASPQLQACVQ